MANRISFYNDDEERPVRGSWRHRRGAQIAAIALLAVFAITSAVLIIKFSDHKGFLGQQEDDSAKKDALGGDSSVYSNDRMMTDDIANSENVHLRRGRDSYLKGYLNDAYAEFSEVVESDASDKDKAVALTYMGIIEDERKNHEKALTLLFRATKYNDENPVTWRNIAIVYRNTGRMDDAIKYIKKAIDLDERNTQNLMLLGNLYFTLQDYSAAIDAYRDVLEIEPSNATGLFNLGQTYARRGDETSAHEYFRKAAEADGKGRVAYLAWSRLGTMALDSEGLNNAEKYLEMALAINATNAVDHYNLGIVYLRQKKDDLAIKSFEKAQQLGRENVELLESLGSAYTKMRDYDRGLEVYKRLLGINSRNIRALSQIGELYYRQGHFDKAITYYEEIIKAAPASEHARLALLNMGGILLESERYDEAIDAYNKALVINPKDDAALYNLGIAYRHLGKTEKAIDSWKSAMRLNPENAKPALALADLLYENGYLDDAIKEYEVVSEKWPTVSEAHFSLATIFYKKEQYDFAQRRYEKVITLNNDPELVRKSYINQAIILSRDGANEETMAKAIQSARKALMLKPGDPAALLTLGNIFYRQELYDRAIETWYQALKSSPDRESTAMAWNNIGKACYKKGDYKESLRAFTRATEEDPTNEEIRINRKAAMQAYEQNL